MNIQERKNLIVKAFDKVWLRKHIFEANKLQREFRDKYLDKGCDVCMACMISINKASDRAYHRNKWQNYRQRYSKLDWDDSPYVEVKYEYPKPPRYKFNEGRLGKNSG